MSNQTSIKKEKIVGIRFKPQDAEKLEAYALKNNQTLSSFCRRVMLDYIEAQENPELAKLKQATIPNVNQNVEVSEIKDILSAIKNQQDLQQEMILKLMNREISRFPSKLDEDENLDENIEKIAEVLKKSHNPLTMRKIIAETKIEDDLVFDILTNVSIFKSKNGKWLLNE